MTVMCCVCVFCMYVCICCIYVCMCVMLGLKVLFILDEYCTTELHLLDFSFGKS